LAALRDDEIATARKCVDAIIDAAIGDVGHGAAGGVNVSPPARRNYVDHGHIR
jgi:hypothetical protein